MFQAILGRSMRDLLNPLVVFVVGGGSTFDLSARSLTLDVPFAVPADRRQAGCASSTVAGLDPGGDGFLAVRTGPGADHQKIGELRNGDVVRTCDARGAWVAVVYGPVARKGGCTADGSGRVRDDA